MPGKKLSPQDLDHFRAQLNLMLGVLRGDMDHLTTDALGDGGRLEMQGDDGEIYHIEFSLELLQRDERTAREIAAALERIQKGAFGRCANCDAWLMKDRLRAVPHARRCITCQRDVETESA